MYKGNSEIYHILENVDYTEKSTENKIFLASTTYSSHELSSKYLLNYKNIPPKKYFSKNCVFNLNHIWTKNTAD